jgi:WS/DGAT/MGAT family acyltransferase
MARAPSFDTRMSDAEGLMWRLDKDPMLSGTFGNITLLDRPPDLARLCRRMARAAQVVPRLHQRVQPAPFNVSPPSWVTDPNFDLDYHIRRVGLPAPGSLRELLDFAALVTADPFDRTRPLWQFLVVEGLQGGRAALVQKFHHTVTDGVAGVRLSMQFLDLERNAPDPVGEPSAPDEPPTAAPNEEAAADPLRTALAGGLRLPLGLARQLTELMVDPTQVPHAAGTVKAIVAQLTDVDKARSPLWTTRSLKRRLETLQVPLDGVKAAAAKLGGSVNTAFLTAAADAAGAYHRQLDAPVEELRATMAISTRTDDSGSNAFTLARLLVPTGSMSVAERFALIHEQASAAREASGSASLDKLAVVAGALPTSLVTRLARQQSQTVDFATSNVRAAPFTVYIAGAKVLANYPIGPTAGVAFNLTTMSYLGSMDMGVHIDAGAVAEPERLRSCLQQSFRRLVKA